MLPNTKKLPAWGDIDTDPANIGAMVDKGSFFSWQDGVWRYMPHNGGVYRVDSDVVEKFEHAATFGAYGVACHPAESLVCRIHPDGTRGIHSRWSRDTELTLRAIYGDKSDDERHATQFVLDTMAEKVAA